MFKNSTTSHMISRKIPNNGVNLIRRSSSEAVKRTRFASSAAAWARRAHRLSIPRLVSSPVKRQSCPAYRWLGESQNLERTQ